MTKKFEWTALCGAVALSVMAVSSPASAQTDIPPPIVRNLADPDDANPYSPWLGAAFGTTVAIVGVNAWSGGALLTPAVGATLSGVLGGAWLGTVALTPIAAQSLFESSTLIATGIVGGGMGYWLAGE